MNQNQNNFHRRSVRLPGYDYSSIGGYFVTICVDDHSRNLGRFVNGKIFLSPTGRMAQEFWVKIPHHFPHVGLDQFIIMPNHVHGIITFVDEPPGRGVQSNAPTSGKNHLIKTEYYSRISPVIGSLPVIIRTYKAAVTHWCRNNGSPNLSWQRNYYACPDGNRGTYHPQPSPIKCHQSIYKAQSTQLGIGG